MPIFSNFKKANPVAVLILLVKKLRVPVSSFTIENEFKKHPDFPSLLAVVDCLHIWKIPHKVYHMENAEFSSDALTYPFIAHIPSKEKFILIHEIVNKDVMYSDELHSNIKMSEIEFLKSWDGVVLCPTKNEQSGEEYYRGNLIRGWLVEARIPFLVLVILLSILAAINYAGIFEYLLILFFKIAGLIVSTLLIIHSVNANSRLVKNICSLGKKSDCNVILNSDVAKITSWLSWSEVGLFYFAGSLLCLLVNPATFYPLAFLNIACLPYTVYSIYYQVKTKSWCIMCITVQTLLWLEAITYMSGGAVNLKHLVYSSTSGVFFSLICFSFPIAIWGCIKPIILKAHEVNSLKNQLKKFISNQELFYELLTKEKQHEIPDELYAIHLGDPAAEIVITIVSNLHCAPCARAHDTLSKWLNEGDGIYLKILFTTANDDFDNNTKIARHIIALSLVSDLDTVKEALNDWYSQNIKLRESWMRKYPVKITEEAKFIIKKQKEWCDNNEVNFTPTILINGYRLIEPYQLEDIRYMLAA